MGRVGAGIARFFGTNDFRQRMNFHAANRPAFVISSKGGVQFDAGTVLILYQHRQVQFSLREPDKASARRQIMPEKSAEKNIRAAGADGGVAVDVVPGIVMVV